jgi:hypothetical protein
MNQSHFTISFIYEIIPESLQAHLCAEIEMIANDACLVRNIRRANTGESSLLPVLKLVNVDGMWVHSNGGKKSNIGRAIGEAIDQHLKQLSKSRDQMKDR